MIVIRLSMALYGNLVFLFLFTFPLLLPFSSFLPSLLFLYAKK